MYFNREINDIKIKYCYTHNLAAQTAHTGVTFSYIEGGKTCVKGKAGECRTELKCTVGIWMAVGWPAVGR